MKKECCVDGIDSLDSVDSIDSAADNANSADSANCVDSADNVEFCVQPVPCSTQPILYDSTLCVGCNRCVEVCQCDILMPSQEKGGTPIVMYPGECYYCGACVMACPKPGAIELVHPLMNRAKFVPVRQAGH